MSGYVFISYSRADRPYVDLLADYLRDAGVPVWYDWATEVGEPFPKVIQDRIDACAAVIVVLTPSARESTWVAREIVYAESVRHEALVVRMEVEDLDLPAVVAVG